MKRYLLSILLAAAALVGIGSYCVYGAMNPYPDFRMVVREGDENLLDGAIFGGTLVREYGSWKYGRYYAEVTTEGTEYEFERSLFKKRNRHPLEAELAPDAHAFLRGKRHHAVNFYLDDRMIVYGELDTRQAGELEREVTAMLEMMDLATGKRTDIRTVLEAGTRERSPYLADVQRFGDELHLFIEMENQYRVYVLTFEGRLVRKVDVQLPLGPEEEGTHRRVWLASNHRPHAAKGVVGIQVMTYGRKTAQPTSPMPADIYGDEAANFVIDTNGDALSRVDLYVYDYAEERIRPVGTLHAEDALEAGRSISNQMTDTHHHLVWHDSNQLRIKQISLSDGSVRTSGWTADQLGGSIGYVTLHDGKVYVLAVDGNGYEKHFAVNIFDLDSSAMVGKAGIEPTIVTVGDVSETLYLHGLVFR
jgi:hypothetical protein